MRNYFSKFLLLLALIFSLTLSAQAKIWDVTAQAFISEKKLFQKLKKSKTVLLGMKQNNPQHYKLAANIIDQQAKNGATLGVFLTNIERHKQNAFQIFTQRHRGSEKIFDATGLDMLLEWPKSNEVNWAAARPLYDMAMMKKIPLHAIDFSRYEIGQLHRDGLAGLPDDISADVKPLLSASLPAAVIQDMTTHINQQSCNSLPPEVVAKFRTIQRARNALFAVSLARFLKTASPRKIRKKTALLIAEPQDILKKGDLSRNIDKLNIKGPIYRINLMGVDKPHKPPLQKNNKVDFIWYTEKASDLPLCPS